MNYQKIQSELLTIRKDLYHELSLHRKKIEKIEEELKKNKEELSNCCITFYGSHLWKNEDEDGMYGERFVVCQRCGVEY